ncbi:MAG: AMP phosphorylase [Candidatus Heimdallarchaeota archaeon]|jgi:AMP phosphorylase|nr:AMP phosphorylase [Candidatus Heimdallarchaeota archaeon]MCK4253928.1 AMP phosphorylase [Candidatus Heimdallarchaeota archaeon]
MPNLKIQKIDVNIERSLVFVNAKTLDKYKIQPSANVKIKSENSEVMSEVISTDTLVEPGFIGLSEELITKLRSKVNKKVNVFARKRPASLEYVKNKQAGKIWTESNIRSIVSDICVGQYTDLELAMFTLAQYYKGLDMNEIQFLTQSMAEFGTTIDFDEPVYDKHSIGGIPGNKVSLIIVPTVAAAGLLIPKTSSRAITSPSGTADTMEVLCNVNFSSDEILELAPKVRGMLVWGGTLDLSPLDEIVIHKVEQPLGIDPHSQMLASIFSKKVSTGVDHLVLDIPTGTGSKMPTRESAIQYAQESTELGRRLGIHIEAALSYGEQPLGKAIGPALEAREALDVLLGNGPTSVLEKSNELSGILFEMAGLATAGQGAALAADFIKKGKAKAKMEEILAVQGGNPNIKPEEVEVGEYTVEVLAPKDGYIVRLSNVAVKKVAYAAGTPSHKKAGVYLHKKSGDFCKKDDKLMTIYSDSEGRLTEALNLATNLSPYVLEGMILKRISSGPRV